MASLEGKKVLVVGGSSGIGFAAATAAAQAGAKVTIASRSRERLEMAATAIGRGVTAHVLDATDDASVEAFFGDGMVWDHVVASAGKGGRGRLPDMTMETALAAMDAKFWAYFRIARAAGVAPDGSITLVSGGLSRKPAPAAALVSATNAAVEGLTRGLAIDYSPVRVNTVCPGIVDTPLWDQLSAADRKALYERAAATLPAKRIGQPEDIAQAILFLMTNPFVTGSVLVIEGGSLLV